MSASSKDKRLVLIIIILLICMCVHSPGSSVTMTSGVVCEDVTTMQMRCSICNASQAVVWTSDVGQVRFYSGDNKTSQPFMLSKDLNCSVVISWAAGDHLCTETIMLCQSNDGWRGLDGANLTCHSDSDSFRTVMKVKACPPITHPSPSVACTTNSSSEIIPIVVGVVVTTSILLEITIIVAITAPLVHKIRNCSAVSDQSTVELHNTTVASESTASGMGAPDAMVIPKKPVNERKIMSRHLMRTDDDNRNGEDDSTQSTVMPMQANYGSPSLPDVHGDSINGNTPINAVHQSTVSSMAVCAQVHVCPLQYGQENSTVVVTQPTKPVLEDCTHSSYL